MVTIRGRDVKSMVVTQRVTQFRTLLDCRSRRDVLSPSLPTYGVDIP